MHVPPTNKEQLRHQLQVSKQKAFLIELKLSFNGRYKEAAEVKKRVEALNRRIDSLLVEEMRDLLENSDKTISDVNLINKKVQRCIDDIHNNVDITENTVKLVGFIDDIVKIVAVII